MNDGLGLISWRTAARPEARPAGLQARTTGNCIPALANAIPVLDHPIQTLAMERKRADVARFYVAGTDPAEPQAIPTQYGVDHIWGPAEWALGEFDTTGLPIAFQQGKVRLLHPPDIKQSWNMAKTPSFSAPCRPPGTHGSSIQSPHLVPAPGTMDRPFSRQKTALAGWSR